MSVAHILFNAGTAHGAILRDALVKLEDARTELIQLKGTMQLMIEEGADGSQASHYAYMQEKFGFADNISAKAAWDELNSVLFKLTTNDSVTNVNAAPSV